MKSSIAQVGNNMNVVEYVKDKFPAGTRVVLLKMDDPHAPPVGTQGTVRCVDDIATVHVSWDNGSGLGAVWGEDVIKVVETE